MSSLENILSNELGVQRSSFGSTARSMLCTLLCAIFSLTSRREVIVPSFCCESVLISVLISGGKPVLNDVSFSNYSISIDHTKTLITRDTAAVIVPHMFGISAYSDQLFELHDKHKSIFWIDDACQTFLNLDASGRRIGFELDFGLISFHESKPLSGKLGGVLLTCEKSDAHLIMDKLKNNNTKFIDPSIHHQLRRFQEHYFSALIGLNRDLSIPSVANPLYIDKLRFLYSEIITPSVTELLQAGQSIRQSLSQSDQIFPNNYFATYLMPSPHYIIYHPRQSDRLWRVPLLLESPDHQRPLSYQLRSSRINVSNHYYPLSSLFPQYSQGRYQAESISSRILNLWFDSIVQAVRAAEIISTYFQKL